METIVEKPKKTPRPKKQSAEDALIEKFLTVTKASGCPLDQCINFIKAGCWLQPKQLQFAALARQCDLPSGPKAILSGGGRGSSKSHAIFAQIFCDDCQRVPGLKVLFLRKVGGANKEQVSDFVRKILHAIPHKYRESAPAKVEFPNGSFVILGNFKDEGDIDKYLGLEYDLIYIMESNQLTQTKKMNILSCLRTNKTNWRPRCYQDTNPGGIDHVANKRLFVDPWKAGKQTETRYLHSTVDDNAFVDKGYKEYLEKLVGWQREAWLNGSWEFMAGAFFSNFHPDTNVYPNAQTDLAPRTIVRWFAGLDYGFSHPNAFALCCETESGDIFVTNTYSASSTLIEEHAANIFDILRLWNLDPAELEFIAAGKDCFRVDKDGSTVATEYQEHGIILEPVHIDRVNAWSQVAEVFGDPSHQIRPRCFIHKNCSELILQIQSAQSDPKRPNDVLKMNADAESGEGGDDLLEACLVPETLVTCFHGDVRICDLWPGMEVLTRLGWKKILSCGITGRNKKIFRVEMSNGREILGTGNHPVWANGAWRRLDSLRNGDIVSICLKYNAKLSYSTASNSAATQTQNREPIGFTIGRGAKSAMMASARCIKKSGNRFMGLSQRAFTFITRTATALITGLKIWNARKAENTSPITFVPCPWLPSGRGWITPESLRSHGIIQKRQVSSQKETGRQVLGNALSRGNIHANTAAKSSYQTPLSPQNSATSIARLRSKGETLGILRMPNAPFAERNSSGTNTQNERPRLAPAHVVRITESGKSDVFNLEVEGCPEYFANGVLVHNCRNAIVMAYSSLLKSAMPMRLGNFQPMVGAGAESDSYRPVEDVIAEAERNEEERRAGLLSF